MKAWLRDSALFAGFRRRGETRRIERTVSDFNRSLVLVEDQGSLQASIAARLDELFRPARIVVLQLAADGRGLVPTFSAGLDAARLEGVRFQPRGRLARWLLTNESCLELAAAPGVAEYLDAAERQLLERLALSVCAPLVCLNRLNGILGLGFDGGRRLDAEETELLAFLAAQAGMAFENATLYREQRDRARRLQRAERLAAAGRLAAGVAHEVRNPLTAIRSTVQYVLAGWPRDGAGGRRRELLEEVLEEVDRIEKTVSGLLSLAREHRFQPEPLDLVEVVEQALRLVDTQARHQGVAVEPSLPAGTLDLEADPSQVRQLFLNLLLNGLQAMPGGGRLAVEVTRRQGRFAAESGPWAEVRIADSGPGIAAADLERVFDPFFTTKPDGTGLGLALCHGIVERHGGEIEIESAEGRGTTARVRLPLSL